MIEQPKSAPVRLRTHHVFLDTQVYRKLGHNPAAPPLVALKELLSSGRLVLHITDVIFQEVERQLHDFVGETTSALKGAKRHLGRWVQRYPKLVTTLPEFDQAAISMAAFRDFSSFIRSVRAIEHGIDTVPPSIVFERYFKREPPFHKLGSKEFPDAFNIAMLEAWCDSMKETIYVVGADKAVCQAVDQSEHLLAMNSLEDLLASVAAMDEPQLVAEARTIFTSSPVQAQLEAAIEAQIGDLIPIYVGGDLPEGEVIEHQLDGEISIGEFKVLATSATGLRVVVPVNIPLVVDVSYEDRSDAIYDSEDGKYLFAESATKEIRADPTIRFFARVFRDPSSKDVVVEAQPVNVLFRVNDEFENYK